MFKVIDKLTELKYALPRLYAQWRIGATRKESRSYNTTNRVLLTFDDFGTSDNVYGILRVLEQENVKAVFFLCGEWAEKNPKIVAEITRRGHWLGNHSHTHPRLDKLPEKDVRTEIRRGLQTELLRPPYGAYNKSVRQVAATEGFMISFWTIDSWDWRGISATEMLKIILPRLHKGACILLHLNAPNTLEALPGIIAGVRARGLELCHDGTEIKVS